MKNRMCPLAVLLMEKGPCGLTLQQTAKYISLYYLMTIIFGAVLTPHTFSLIEVEISFCILLFANVALFFGALCNNRSFVLIWLIQGLIFLLTWPFLFTNVPINFGFPSGAYAIFTVFVQFFMLVLFLPCAFYVYCFYHQLGKIPTKPMVAVMV